MRWMRIAAGEGDPDAQGVLAVFLHEGLGTVKGFPQAFSWAQKSATQNNIVGETILAELYQKGEGHGGRCKEG
jgi:TPR repeat protein